MQHDRENWRNRVNQRKVNHGEQEGGKFRRDRRVNHSAAYRPQPNWKTGSIAQYEAIAHRSVLPSLTILLKKQDSRG